MDSDLFSVNSFLKKKTNFKSPQCGYQLEDDGAVHDTSCKVK